MKERPILFSAPMVRALLDGSKTQTRRVVKVRNEQPPAWATFGQEGSMLTTSGSRPSSLFYWSEEQAPAGPLKTLQRWPLSPPHHPMAGDHYWTPCPYGKPGDCLWARETARAEELPDGLDGVRYQADDAFIPVVSDPESAMRWLKMKTYGKRTQHDGQLNGPWVPSIHMTRWASRKTLEISAVRVERLQDISEADAQAEGCNQNHNRYYWGGPHPTGGRKQFPTAVDAYRSLWESINGAGSWDLNPWVWVVEFKRIAP